MQQISSIFNAEAAKTAAIRNYLEQEDSNRSASFITGYTGGNTGSPDDIVISPYAAASTIAITSDDGQIIGTITTDPQGRESYTGAPCLAHFAGTGAAREDGAAIVTDTYANAKILSGSARDIYVVCGQPERAIGTGLAQLSRHSGAVLVETCHNGGIMRDEQTLKRIAGHKIKVMLPGLSYRQAGSPASCRQLDDEIRGAAPVRNPGLGSLRGVKLTDRYNTEKIKTPFGGLNTCLYGGIPRGQVTLFASKSGNGKSTVILQIVCNAIEQGHRAAIYSGEMTPADIAGVMTRQIAGPDHVITREVYGRACPAIADDIADDINENVLAPAVTPVLDTYGSRTPWTDWQDTIIDAIVQEGHDVIVVDNLMTLVTLIMRERKCGQFEAQGIASAWLEHTAISYDVYILLVAHLRKGLIQDGSDKNDAVSGASDIVNAAGVVIFYEREKNQNTKDADEDMPDQTTIRIMYLTKNRLFGDVYYNGWRMDYDRISQRTYPANNPRGYMYQSAWQKRREQAQADEQKAREAEQRAILDARTVVITWDPYILKVTGLAERVQGHLDNITREITQGVPAGPNRVIYKAGDVTQEAPYTVDADELLSRFKRGKLYTLTADGVDITIE